MSLLAAENREGFKALVGEVGWWEAIQVGMRVETERLRGEPFDELGPPDSEAERLSREQMAPAVLMYEALCERHTRDRAYEISEAVVTASAVRFLDSTVGRLDRGELLSMHSDERVTFVEQKGAKFHNAELRWETIEPDEVAFTVTRCHFVELCREVGVPELAPAFCAGDAKFFGGVEEEVSLQRETTIAEGEEVCPFQISLE
jgi:hypothetical protein